MTDTLLAFDIRNENDVVIARQKSRLIAEALKFDSQDQTRIATAVSEIARNTLQYGGGGSVEFSLDPTHISRLLITLSDHGRGIPNLQQILDGKHISQTGMGIGLVGAKKLMDSFHIETSPTRGTLITLGKNLPARYAHVDSASVRKALSTLERAAQTPYEELRHQNQELLSALDALRSKQDELAQLNRELDETNRGVVALYAELNEKADFLQRASELKSRFLSNMSHEFRTPLNSILGLTQILLDRLDGELTPEQEKQVRFVRSSAQGLTDLVNDLLDLAKVEAGKVVVRPAFFKISTLFAALRGMLRPLVAQNSSISLVLDDPPVDVELYTDEAKVSQILRNFISNALKFTERGEIRVSAIVRDDETVVFSVADTGIGIAPSDQDRIFQEWTQVDGRLQKTIKGSGLGLPLSRKFAQLLGGDVHVESTMGIGSTFSAVIPVHFAGEPEATVPFETKFPSGPGTLPVLIVEDNPEALFLYERYLRDSQFQAISAKSVRDARRLLREHRPVAVILDVLLHSENTWGLLQELKNDPATSDIPVFVVTVVDNRDKALALGADAFHAKPVNGAWLLDQLAAVSSQPVAKKVLVIDDDEVSRYLVRTTLEGFRFAISEAVGGLEGVRRALQLRPDVIILDLGMPDITGFEVLNRLKQDDNTASIPVIVHTSKILDEDEIQSLRSVLAVISKAAQSRQALLGKFANAFEKAGVLPAGEIARKVSSND
jgi:signal transduction histidine kinase/CheY-like chemotaxis protein